MRFQIIMDKVMLSLLALLTIIVAACDTQTEMLYRESRDSMYTIVTITAVSNSQSQSRLAVADSYAEIDRLARLMNFYDPDSELSEINRSSGKRAVKVSPETLTVIEKAVYVSEMTDGAFDVTVGPLVKLWDIKKQIIPDKQAIDSARSKVGYKNIVINKESSTVYIKTKGAQIDLGGILKGYAADRIIDVLKSHGIKAGIAAVGGEVRAFGKRPGDKSWVVGIQNPRPKGAGDDVIATVEISEKALSTSGDYNKYFEKDGRRYHHLIDPSTGYPSKYCGSTTIVADDGITADGFSKLFILGPEIGLKVAKKAGFDIIFIDCNGKVTISEGLKERISLSGRAKD